MVRPKKPEADVKTYMVTLRVTGDQREELRRAAAHGHLDVSTWLRQLALREAARINERAARKTRDK
jgi:uncharacterized protein (DUF1778 family)